jgi:hypothetical protein
MPAITATERSASANTASRMRTAGRDQAPDATVAGGRRPQSTESRMNRIAARAHAIYEARGGEHGRALDDWLQAEREIDAEMQDERASDVAAPHSDGG